MELTEGALGRDFASAEGIMGALGAESFLEEVLARGAVILPPETPADMLGALLGARLGA